MIKTYNNLKEWIIVFFQILIILPLFSIFYNIYRSITTLYLTKVYKKYIEDEIIKYKDYFAYCSLRSTVIESFKVYKFSPKYNPPYFPESVQFFIGSDIEIPQSNTIINYENNLQLFSRYIKSFISNSFKIEVCLTTVGGCPEKYKKIKKAYFNLFKIREIKNYIIEEIHPKIKEIIKEKIFIYDFFFKIIPNHAKIINDSHHCFDFMISGYSPYRDILLKFRSRWGHRVERALFGGVFIDYSVTNNRYDFIPSASDKNTFSQKLYFTKKRSNYKTIILKCCILKEYQSGVPSRIKFKCMYVSPLILIDPTNCEDLRKFIEWNKVIEDKLHQLTK